MRKAFHFIPWEEAVTPVRDEVSLFVPDQSLSLREIMMQFAYIGTDRMNEIVSRGFIGDEDDDDVTGDDINSLDFAEVHDRLIDLLRPVEIPPPPAPVEPSQEEQETPPGDAQQST